MTGSHVQSRYLPIRSSANPLAGQITFLLCFSLAVLCGMGCASRTVTRTAPETAVDLSGRWNDVDSREVSTAMIQECLNHPWISEWMTTASKKPVVIVGAIRNNTTEHVPVGTFVGDIERALVNSGQVDVVATAAERMDLRNERQDQWQNASEETAKQMGRELGADFMLGGTIESIVDREGGQKVLFYQVDMTLLNIETNRKVWIGQHKIKKIVQQGQFKP
jgi:penicillin-binding protein activator